MVKSAIFKLSPKKTLRASVLNLCPLQSGQTSCPPKYLVPNPLQDGQAPYGELKENNLGSISGKAKPSLGQENFEDSKYSSSEKGAPTDELSNSYR